MHTIPDLRDEKAVALALKSAIGAACLPSFLQLCSTRTHLSPDVTLQHASVLMVCQSVSTHVCLCTREENVCASQSGC